MKNRATLAILLFHWGVYVLVWGFLLYRLTAHADMVAGLIALLSLCLLAPLSHWTKLMRSVGNLLPFNPNGFGAENVLENLVRLAEHKAKAEAGTGHNLRAQERLIILTLPGKDFEEWLTDRYQ